MNEWVHTIAILAVPWILSKVVSLFSKKKVNPQARKPKPKSRLYYAISASLVVFVLWQLLHVVILHPENLLSRLDVGVDDPGFILRNKYRDYIQDIIGSSAVPGSSLPPSSAQDREARLRDEFDRAYEKLRSKDTRIEYMTYGHDAIVNCQWCRDETDYLMYIFPVVGGSYVLALITIGLATIVKQKQHWRTYALIALSIVAAFECYIFTTSHQFRTETFGSHAAIYDLTDRYRRSLFIFLTLIIFVFDNNDLWTDYEILDAIMRQQEQTIGIHHAARVANAVVLGDSSLRKDFLEYFKEQEMHKEAVRNDSEFKTVVERVKIGYNVDRMLEEAKMSSEKIVHEGMYVPDNYGLGNNQSSSAEPLISK